MAIREVNTLKRGTVRLGVGPTTSTYRLPPTFGHYMQRFPDIELVVLAGTTEFLLEALQAQQLDLAVVMANSPRPGIHLTLLGHEELVVVLNHSHPLASRRTLEPADLSELRFILYGRNTAMQNLIDRYFEALGVRPRISMEVENNEAIKSLVRAGLEDARTCIQRFIEEVYNRKRLHSSLGYLSPEVFEQERRQQLGGQGETAL